MAQEQEMCFMEHMEHRPISPVRVIILMIARNNSGVRIFLRHILVNLMFVYLMALALRMSSITPPSLLQPTGAHCCRRVPINPSLHVWSPS